MGRTGKEWSRTGEKWSRTWEELSTTGEEEIRIGSVHGSVMAPKCDTPGEVEQGWGRVGTAEGRGTVGNFDVEEILPMKFRGKTAVCWYTNSFVRLYVIWWLLLVKNFTCIKFIAFVEIGL